MRWLAASATLAVTLLALVLTRLWLVRAALPYNEEGRHFRVEDAVVVDEGAILVSRLLALLCWFVVALLAYGTYRIWRR